METTEELCDEYISLLENVFEVRQELKDTLKTIKDIEKKICNAFEVDGETMYKTSSDRVINLETYTKKSKSLPHSKLIQLMNEKEKPEELSFPEYLASIYEEIPEVEAKKIKIFPPFKRVKLGVEKKENQKKIKKVVEEKKVYKDGLEEESSDDEDVEE